MTKVAASEFVLNYPEVQFDQIRMDWNGKRGLAFHDHNQSFRGNVIMKVIEAPQSVDIELIKVLFVEEALWSAKSLSYRYFLTELLEWMLVNAFDVSIDVIADALKNNQPATKCVLDFSISDEQVRDVIRHVEQKMRMASDRVGYEQLIKELDNALGARQETLAQKEAFERYVTEKDKVHVAAKKTFIQFLKEGEIQFIALFVIIPFVLLLGYYLYGINVVIAMIPLALALMTIFLVYKFVSFVIR